MTCRCARDSLQASVRLAVLCRERARTRRVVSRQERRLEELGTNIRSIASAVCNSWVRALRFARHEHRYRPLEPRTHPPPPHPLRCSESDAAALDRRQVVGLVLMYLLVEARLAEFHAEVELLNGEADRSAPAIAFPLSLEASLMEGAYNKVRARGAATLLSWPRVCCRNGALPPQVLAARKAVPSEHYAHFMDKLTQTVRDDIADSAAAAYTSLPVAAAQRLLMLDSAAETLAWVRSNKVGGRSNAHAGVHAPLLHPNLPPAASCAAAGLDRVCWGRDPLWRGGSCWWAGGPAGGAACGRTHSKHAQLRDGLGAHRLSACQWQWPSRGTTGTGVCYYASAVSYGGAGAYRVVSASSRGPTLHASAYKATRAAT
jgi:hypothetical protein